MSGTSPGMTKLRILADSHMRYPCANRGPAHERNTGHPNEKSRLVHLTLRPVLGMRIVPESKIGTAAILRDGRFAASSE